MRQWLRAIQDTLDEQVNEAEYDDPNIQQVFDAIEPDLISPVDRAKMFEENNQEEFRQTDVRNKQREIAQSMLADGLEVARVARLTGLPEAEIIGLRE